ncbi:hypothetical protein, partial [Mesorhizobium sp. M4B.F.Ca.ET.089.01.1.1]|uniref:hypothetical protein n=1 Tax=Mesorhizobium sp. M4B.F.Ca.ET.089.01.1.1 TaxID=2496662 RepID=UPI0016749D17
ERLPTWTERLGLWLNGSRLGGRNGYLVKYCDEKRCIANIFIEDVLAYFEFLRALAWLITEDGRTADADRQKVKGNEGEHSSCSAWLFAEPDRVLENESWGQCSPAVDCRRITMRITPTQPRGKTNGEETQ